MGCAHRGAGRCARVTVVAAAVLTAACGLYDNDHHSGSTPTAAQSTSTARSSAALTTSAGDATPAESRASLLRRGCHLGDPRAGVNTPLRLIVRDPCITVHGIAGCIYEDKGDGDTHIALLLSKADAAKYLTPGNRSWSCNSDQGSDTAPRLVIEVIPQHCVVRDDNCADRGHFKDPDIPENGQHVTVTGAWVQDTSTFRGRTLWSEIHPAFRITPDPGDPGVAVQNGGNFEKDGGD